MAKDLGLLDNGRRKIGNVVLQRNNVQRVRKLQIKNPRTQGQIIQRVIVATAAGMAAGLKGIVNHSFETIPYGGKSIAEFRKLALKALREQAKIDLAKPREEQQGCFVPYGISACLPNETIISRGSLVYDTDYLPHWEGGDNGDLYMHSTITADVTGWTASEWWWYFFGMRPKKQLTWLFMGYDNNLPDQNNCIYSAVPFQVSVYEDANRHIKTPLVKAMRMVMKDSSSEYWNMKLLPTLTRAEAIGILVSCIDHDLSDEWFWHTMIDNVDNPSWNVVGDAVSMTLTHKTPDEVVQEWSEGVIAAAGIHSEYYGGKWRRSTSKLLRTRGQYPNLTGESIHHSPWQGLNISDAIASWLDAPRSSESDRYLNEGL